MQNQSTSIKTRLLFLIPTLILAGILMVVFQDFVRDVVVIPVLYLVWVIEVLLDIIPQTFIWALMLVSALLSILRSFEKRALAARRTSKPFAPARGKVEMWAQRIYLRNRGAYSKERFAYYLGKLVQDVLIYDARYTPRELIQQLDNGELTVPAEVENYLRFRLRPVIPQSRNLLQRLKDRIKRWLYRTPSPSELSSDELVQVINFLEEQLEISTGGSE